jgi:hypothetical protein
MVGLPRFNKIRLITRGRVRAIGVPNCKMRFWGHDLMKTYDLCSRAPTMGNNLMRVFYARRNWYSLNALSSEHPHNTSGFVLATKLADISSGIATAFN